jgi:ubiquinone/menaquinone biosynthesis C-methylase UbiE
MKKNWTGERLETFIYNENTLEHLHRYAIAMQLVKGKQVMDIACGEGYGSNLLAQQAAQVTGVDISGDAVEAAKKKYKRPNLNFLEGSAAKIPAADNSLDVVVSFETIEHHDQHEEMLSEIKRVLRKDGLLIISTPDKANYTDKRNFQNEHHVKELYQDEFRQLITKYFSQSRFFFQRTDFFSLIVPEDGQGSFASYSGTYDQIKQAVTPEPVYLICVAADREVVLKHTSIFGSEGIFKSMVQQAVDNVKSSRSFQLGNMILRPFQFLKGLGGKAANVK